MAEGASCHACEEPWNYSPEKDHIYSEFIDMQHCWDTHTKYPDIPQRNLRGGICPSHFEFNKYYSLFMKEMHPESLKDGCQDVNKYQDCPYFKLSIKKIFDGKTLNQEYLNEFVNSTKYNNLIRNDNNNLIRITIEDEVKQVTPEMQAKAKHIH